MPLQGPALPGAAEPEGGAPKQRFVQRTIAFFAACAFACCLVSACAAELKFDTHRIGHYRSEACGVGDFNNDGKLDIIAGAYLYLAPDWNPVKVRTLNGSVDEKGDGYMFDFMNVPFDVDGDGWLDVVSCSWHEKRSTWSRNTGPKGGEWPETVIEENGNFEHGDLWDIDGDGKANEIVPGVRGTIWYEIGKLPNGQRGLLRRVVSEKSLEWGVGAGDVNGDGRIDFLRPNAWFEAPADPRTGLWKEHPLALGTLRAEKTSHTPQIYTYDVNGDGWNDIVTSSAHEYGIFWYEQQRAAGALKWKQHVIDDSWSQAHSLTLADLDKDGDLDLVTGKRFRAHNGGDPGETEPLGVYWYELTRRPSVRWTKHIITYGQGIGSGMNIPVVDLDQDGDLDIVVTGKWGGPAWFENKK